MSTLSSSTARFDEILELSPELRHQLRRGRELVEERRADSTAAQATTDPRCRHFPTALPELDRLLGGGMARGSMVEAIGHRTSGRFSLVLSTLASATRLGEAAALVDLGDHFDPQSAVDAGVESQRLLWLRPEHVKSALACVEILLDGGFPLVIFDLGLPPVPGGRGAEASWLRLARAAQAHECALLVTSPYRVSGTAARAVMQLERRPGERRVRWEGGRSPLLLHGLRTRVRLTKARRELSLPVPEHRGSNADVELHLHCDSLAEPRVVDSTEEDSTREERRELRWADAG